MAIMKSALEKKSRILALRNAEIALLDPDRCIMEWQIIEFLNIIITVGYRVGLPIQMEMIVI